MIRTFSPTCGEATIWSTRGGLLEDWVPSRTGELLHDQADGLHVVAEASGPYERWFRSDTTTVRLFRRWSSDHSRANDVMIWTRDGRS